MAPPFEIKTADDKEIKSLRGWKAGSSKATKELARYWMTDMGPGALSMVLDHHPGTKDFKPKQGVVGAKTKFDELGGPRSHDLLLTGEAAAGPTVVSIEGKIDEPFSQTLEEYRDAFTR